MMYEVRREPPLKLPATSPLWWSIPGAYLRKLLKPESWGCVQTARSRAFGTRSAVMGRKQSHWRHQSSSYTGQGPLKESKRVCRDKQQGDRTKHQYLHFHCKAKAWLVRLGAESRLLSWAKGWHQPTLQTDLHGSKGTSPSQPSSERHHQKTSGLSAAWVTLPCDVILGNLLLLKELRQGRYQHWYPHPGQNFLQEENTKTSHQKYDLN